MDKKTIGMVLGVVCASAVPFQASAAVRINEVAWMGSSSNANAEWIELFNDEDTPVSLSGWMFSASNGSPLISLTGSIGGKGFYLLERTGDTSVPEVHANQIYTGALSNSGATLTLKDATGTTIDEVVGGSNWANIGGDNITKQTPQRSSDGANWTTADGTPGATNTETAVTTNSTTATPTPKVPTFPHIYIDGVKDVVVSTLDNFEPEALVYDDDTHRVQYATIHWAFGDGAHDFGYEPRHVYEYPGEYLVGVAAESNNLKTDTSFVVKVDDADIHLSENSARGIGLYNADDRIVNLSNWHLKLGEALYDIPEGTQLLPERTVIFPTAVTGLKVFSDQLSLLYPSGRVATTFIQTFAVKAF